jgi:ribosomal protein S18 acetylase RimI-like enzyme
VIRPARPTDVPAIVALIVELATYERAVEEAKATPEQLSEALFGPSPAVFCLVAEQDEHPEGDARGGVVVGFAIWFVTFSTWLGRHGIYLEDLFVRPAARRNGHGRALLAELAGIATERGYGRVDWAVLDWNEPAQEFYSSIGAEPMSEWTTWRLTGSALASLPVTTDARPTTSRG